VTNRFTSSTLGLPCYVDMTRTDIARVCSALATALAPHESEALVVAA
jgi:dTDP-4-amino-4,6-dideoxygalactose transaminase